MANSPTIKDVRPVDPVLTDLSIGFKNEAFMWDQIAPVKQVTQRSATYFTYDREYWLRRQDGAERAEGGSFQRVGFGVSSATYKALQYGFEQAVDDVTRDGSQTPETLDTLAVAFVTNLIQIELEKLVAAAFFATSKWGTDNTLSGNNQWSDFANSDPIGNIDTAIRTILRNTGARNNIRGFIGLTGWEKIKEHPLIIEKYKHTQTGIMTEELVAKALGLSSLTVGSAVENTAAEEATFVGADIWTDSLLVAAMNPPGLQSATAGATIMWNQAGNIPWAIQRYREEAITSDIVRAFTHAVPKVVSAQHAYYFADLVA